MTNAYAVRRAWEAMKTAALRGGAPLVPAMSLAAIEKWAEIEGPTAHGLSRPEREAWAASVAGAAMVDAAIEKLAEAGRYTEAEREFLLDLNAEAAVRDLRSLCKSAGILGNALNAMAAHPRTTGTIAGAAISGGLGAWKDDENRLRGAVSYGVPGAVLGYLGGTGLANYQQNRHMARLHHATQLLEQQAAQQAQSLANQRALADMGRVADDAARLHKNFILAAQGMARDRNVDPNKVWAITHAIDKLQDHSHDIIQHAVINPGMLHTEVANMIDPEILKEIQGRAAHLQKQGPYVPLGSRLHPDDLIAAAQAHSRSSFGGGKGGQGAAPGGSPAPAPGTAPTP